MKLHTYYCMITLLVDEAFTTLYSNNWAIYSCWVISAIFSGGNYLRTFYNWNRQLLIHIKALWLAYAVGQHQSDSYIVWDVNWQSSWSAMEGSHVTWIRVITNFIPLLFDLVGLVWWRRYRKISYLPIHCMLSVFVVDCHSSPCVHVLLITSIPLSKW